MDFCEFFVNATAIVGDLAQDAVAVMLLILPNGFGFRARKTTDM